MDQGDGMAYLTEPVTIGNITRTVNATGEVGAVQLVSVGAQVGGQIKKLHVVLGQDVKKGDLIAEIDSVPQLNQLETDKARLQSYESQLAAKKVALKIAKTKYDREMQLKKRDAASKESLEDAENAYALAKAEVTELESQIRQARIAVNTDEVNLGYTRITAPLDGTIVSVPVDEGQTVNANQTTPTIVQIADLDKMEIKIEISEGDITAVKPGMPITYTILSNPETEYKATLTSIDPGLTTLTDGSYKTTSSTGSSASSSSVSSSARSNTLCTFPASSGLHTADSSPGAAVGWAEPLNSSADITFSPSAKAPEQSPRHSADITIAVKSFFIWQALL